MTASEIPVGGQFTIAAHDIPGAAGLHILYTVTHQVPGRHPYAHLTYVRYFDPWAECEQTTAWAGHTEVIADPPASESP